MSFTPLDPPDYSDGRTKQAFKDQTDINMILEKATRVGSLSHLMRHGAVYGDFSDVPDLLTAHERIKRGQAIFDELPGEIRREFSNDMFEFFKFVNDPAHREDLKRVLPGLAKPGAQLPEVVRGAAAPAEPAPGAPAGAPASSTT